MKKTYLSLPVELTDAEVRERLEAISISIGKCGEITGKADDLKEQIKDLKAATEAQRARQEKLAEEATSRSEVRSVECRILMDFAGSRVATVRNDTDRVVRLRDMTEGERQMSLIDQETEMSSEERRQMDSWEEKFGRDDDEDGDDDD